MDLSIISNKNYILIPIKYISVDMKIYTPSFLPIHIVTSNPNNHWNKLSIYKQDQRYYANATPEKKIKFVHILMKNLKRQYKIINDEYIYDNINNLNIYKYDKKNKLKFSDVKNIVPCVIGDEFCTTKDIKVKSNLPPINCYCQKCFLRFCDFHAQRIADTTFNLLFKCTLK